MKIRFILLGMSVGYKRESKCEVVGKAGRGFDAVEREGEGRGGRRPNMESKAVD